jgi:hypothetical protein
MAKSKRAMGEKALLVTRIDRRVRRGKLGFLCVLPSIYMWLRVRARGKRGGEEKERTGTTEGIRCACEGMYGTRGKGQCGNVCAEGREMCEFVRGKERREGKGRKGERRRRKTTPAKLRRHEVDDSSLLELASAHPATNLADRTKGASPRRRRL